MEAELSGIVLQTLEARGVLGKIRAELRANVFSAIHEQRGIASDRPNPSLAALRASDGAGRVAAGLLRELLRSCELDYSAAVLLPEAGIAEGPTDRASLAAELGLAAGGDEPLLVQLVRAQLGGGGAAPAPSASRAPLAGRHAPPAVAKQPSPPRGFVDDVVPGKRAAAKQPSPPRGAWGDSGDAEAEAERRLDAIEKKMAGLAGMAGRAPAAAKPAGGFRGDFEDDLDAEDLDEVDDLTVEEALFGVEPLIEADLTDTRIVGGHLHHDRGRLVAGDREPGVAPDLSGADEAVERGALGADLLGDPGRVESSGGRFTHGSSLAGGPACKQAGRSPDVVEKFAGE